MLVTIVGDVPLPILTACVLSLLRCRRTSSTVNGGCDGSLNGRALSSSSNTVVVMGVKTSGGVQGFSKGDQQLWGGYGWVVDQ